MTATVRKLRFRKEDPITERALELRSSGLGRTRILRTLQQDFPKARRTQLDSAASHAARLSREQAERRYLSSTLDDHEWRAWESGESLARIYINRLKRSQRSR